MKLLKVSVDAWIILLIVIASIIPYTAGFYATGLVNLYVAPILLALLLTLYSRRDKVNLNVFGLTLFWLILIISTIPSMITSGSFDSVFNLMRYFLFGTYFLIYVAPLFYKKMKLAAAIITVQAAILSILGFFSLFMGDIQVGIFTINQYYDFQMLGFSFPSTSSIIWNTNYFGVAQMLALPFSVYLLQVSAKYKLAIQISILTICLGVFFSGSRSATLLMILYFLGLAVLKLRVKHLIIGVSFAAVVIMLNASIVSGIYESFLQKGLNGRDIIIEAAMSAIEDQPWGYGIGNEDTVLLDYGSNTTTTQNTYLMYLLRGGYAGLVLYLLILIFTLLKIAFNRHAKKSNEFQTFMAIFFIGLVDGLVRTYSIGGSGFISGIFTIAIGALWIKGNNTNKSTKYGG